MATASEPGPRYPIFIISKGRWDTRLTSRAFERAAIPYRIVIESQEYADYAAVIDPAKILVLPFANLGQGSIPARNWVWARAESEGYRRHWIVDDNIAEFYRFHQNRRYRIHSDAAFRCIEDFADRYVNLALAGIQYDAFAPERMKYSRPVCFNTRIYSCILIDHALPYRWRGRYNEDTDLSLRALKASWCTALFYAFTMKKTPTMQMKGGNTDELYRQDDQFDGRLEMARSLQRQHPDVVRIKRRWGRWQHVVDYRPFLANKLIRRRDAVIPSGIDNYGMILDATPRPRRAPFRRNPTRQPG
jgi:hypothetical protein